MIKIFITICLLFAGRLLAVNPVPYTEGLSFSFRISGYGNGIMTVYDEIGAPSLTQTTYNTTTESSISTAWLRPGKQYTVNFQASGPSEYWLSYIAPAGYMLLVNDQPTTITYNNPGGGWYSYNYLVELRPVANFQAAMLGTFSGIEVGKSASWDVGTGMLRNGRSAGRIMFKELDLSTNAPASRDRLYYSVAGNYGEIEVIKDGASNQTLRQVKTPQGLLDFVDDASGGYWIKCYSSAQLEGSPGNPYIIYGSPWKTIRVQAPAASQLTITDTEGGVAHVSTLTQTMTPTTLATGGTVTTSGNYTIHTFTADGTFTVNSTITGLDAIIVAGGGGGGHQHAGGGGAGGLLPLTSLSVGASSYSITVGGGGAGCTWYPYTGNNGGNSSALGYTAIGGGAGTGMSQYGNNGGSGGGDGYPSGGLQGGSGTAGQGNTGSRSNSLNIFDGGGGGGAGGAGSGAYGGAALGTWAGTFAGGGGGGYAGGPGGGAGAGAGGSGSGYGANASANTGSGGGGGGASDAFGGNGGSGIVVIRYVNNGSSGNYIWQLQEGNGTTWLSTTTHTSTDNFTGTRDDVVTVRSGDTAGTIVAKTKYKYSTFAWGEDLTQIVVDPDSNALTTTYDYYTSDTAYGNYRKVKSVTYTTFNWTAYQYYDDWNRRGQLQYEFHPNLTTPNTPTLNPALGRVVSFDYTVDWTERYTRPTIRQEKVNNVLTGQTTWSHGDIVGSGWPREYSYAYSYRDGSNYQTDYNERFRGDAGLEMPYRTYTSKAASQAQTAISEVSGNYNPSTYVFSADGGTGGWRQLVIHGSTNASGAQAVSSWDGQTFSSIYLIPDISTMEATINDNAGKPIRTESWVYTGGGVFSLMASENLTYDYAGPASAGRLTSREASNGATVSNTYTNGRLTSTVGVDGTENQFTYDLIGRIKTSIKKGVSASGSYAAQGDITNTYTYDGANHVTQTVTSGSSLSLTATSVYDLAGRLISSTAPGNYTTTFAYSSAGNIVTTTFPGGATKITQNHLDGRTKQITGTGVVAEYFTHGVDGNGSHTLQHRLASASTSGVTTTTNDWLGRKISFVQPGWSGSNTTHSWFYNSSGQLYKFSQPGIADTLYSYDTIGGLIREGLDINANGTFELAGSDRITDYAWTFFSSSGWWRRQTTSTYAATNSGSVTQTAKVEQQLSGLATNRLSLTNSYDIFGNVTSQFVEVNRSAKTVTTTTNTPDSTTGAVQIAYNGLNVSAKDTAGITMTYGYDDLGRLTTSVDPRTGTSTTAYKTGTSQIEWFKDAANVTQATYVYDSAGRVFSVKDALNKYKYTSYTTRGEVYRTWGDTTYPVEYVYDNWGQQTRMWTYRGGTGWTGSTWPVSPGPADTTTWNYHEPTSLLIYKRDAPGKRVTYTYTQAGQVATRIGARGVVTTYAYSPSTAELTGVTYSDGTPALSYTYNRLGQNATITDYAGTRTFNYNLTGTLEMQSEDLPSLLDYHRVTYPRATSGIIGQPTGLQLGTSGSPTADQSITYGYQADGRFASLAGGGQTFTYGYATNSHLIATVTNSAANYTDTRTFDPYHAWTDSRSTTISSTTKASFAYTQDNMGRVTQTAKTGEVYNRYGNGTEGLTTYYGYDDRSQLTSEVTKIGTSSTIMTGRNNNPAGYSYDNLGNRTSTFHNGDTATYSTNNLNQYTQRTVPGFFDVAGAADALATVTVNGSSSSVYRHGQYFFKAHGMSNNPNPVCSTLAVSDGTTTTNLPAFTAGTPQAMTYDFDGNLTSDGRWSYLYDAENRLNWMETSSSAITAGHPKVAFYFFYDYLGRRVRKLDYTWSGSAWVPGTDRRFIYDGWNLIAEFYGPYNSGIFPTANVRHHFWGLDLSGSMGGAGGVGGLLMVQEGGNSYLPAYDAMGNVHGMIKASDGSLAAVYEYDAFGNTLRESGTYAASNNFRFSTKYTDIETDLVYYGLRYYSPRLGRFINRDPIGEAGGLNLYGFCGNNGVNRWDYLGNISQDYYLGNRVSEKNFLGYGSVSYSTVGFIDNSDHWGGAGSGAMGAVDFAARNIDFNQSISTAGVYLAPLNNADTGEEIAPAVGTPTNGNQAPNNPGALAAQSAFILAGTAITATPFEMAAAEAAAAAGGGFTAAGAIPLVAGGGFTAAGTAGIIRFTTDVLPVLAPMTTGNNWLKLPTPPITQMGGSIIPVGPTTFNVDNQVKRLSPGEIRILQQVGIDPHDLKPQYQGSRYDLFKDSKGNIQVRPKDGSGSGEPTGININNLPKTGGSGG